MGRIRSVKPELQQQPWFATLTDAAARTYYGLLGVVDDYGRCAADPLFVAGQIFWGQQRSAIAIGRQLAELERAGVIRRYRARGGEYLEILGWFDKGGPLYQHINKPQGERFPAPESDDDRPAAGPQDGPANGPDPIRSDRDPIRSDQDPPPAYAIPPSPEPVPVGVPTTPVVAAPASPDADQLAAHRAARRLVQLELRTELERERRAVAADLGVTDHGLLAQDPGERELAMHLVNAGPAGLAAARGQALHAIAMAGLETRAQPSKFKWLTGAIFAERNFRRLVAMTAEDARAKAGAPAPAKPRKKQDAPLQVSTLTPEERIALAAESRALLYGGGRDGARAPPASAGPTSTDEESTTPARTAT